MSILYLDPTSRFISQDIVGTPSSISCFVSKKGKPIIIKSKVLAKVDCFKIKPFRCKEFLIPKKCFLLAKSSGFQQYPYGSTCMATQEMYLKNWIRARLKLYREPVLLSEKVLPISPYIIGFWAFRGNRTFFNCKSEEVLRRIERECEQTPGLRVDRVNYTFESQVFNFRFSKEFYSFLKDNNLDKTNPEIPRDYQFSSVQQRINCLTGVLDAVGYVGCHSNTFDITVRNDDLTNTIVWLARSLGFYVNVKPTKQLNCGKRKSTQNFRGCVVKRIFVTVDPTIIKCESPNKKLITKEVEASYVCGFTAEDVGEQDILIVETEPIDDGDCIQTDESICLLPIA